jgi:hypothetical protein
MTKVIVCGTRIAISQAKILRRIHTEQGKLVVYARGTAKRGWKTIRNTGKDRA